jgi:hypothetical protein
MVAQRAPAACPRARREPPSHSAAATGTLMPVSFVILLFMFGMLVIGLVVLGARLAKGSAGGPAGRLMQELGVPPGSASVERHGRSFEVRYLPGGKNTPPSMRITGSGAR